MLPLPDPNNLPLSYQCPHADRIINWLRLHPWIDNAITTWPCHESDRIKLIRGMSMLMQDIAQEELQKYRKKLESDSAKLV